MTTPIIPIWRHRSLERHHKKHCVEEPTCFQEVLGLTVQVSQQDYQIASEEAFEKAYIQYDAQEANRQDGGFYPASHYRLDGRSLKTIAHPLLKPSYKWIRGQICTNYKFGPVK